MRTGRPSRHDLVAATAHSQAGQRLDAVHPQLTGLDVTLGATAPEVLAEAKQGIIHDEIASRVNRQRVMDLQQQLLVNQQGFLTTEMIVRNNKELVRGVNRALNTTVSALQVGATLAMALANQRIVLENVDISALGTNDQQIIDALIQGNNLISD